MIGALLKRHLIVYALAIVAFAADQISKAMVIGRLRLGESWPDDGFFRFTHVANRGSALGIIGDANTLLTIASFVGVGILLLFYRSQKNPGKLIKLSLGLMFAGAFGNLTDRIANGHVTDFIDVGPWWIFNIADASIMTGLVVLIGSMLLFPEEPDPTKPVQNDNVATGAEHDDDNAAS